MHASVPDLFADLEQLASDLSGKHGHDLRRFRDGELLNVLEECDLDTAIINSKAHKAHHS